MRGVFNGVCWVLGLLDWADVADRAGAALVRGHPVADLSCFLY